MPAITRRSFFTWTGRLLGGSLAAGAAVGFYTFKIEPHWLSIVKRDMPVANLPNAWVGKNLVQISDLHVGTVVDQDYHCTAIKTIATLKPELTVITGDFMTCSAGEQLERVESLLQHLRPGPSGCYAILGNHDYGMGWSRPDVADDLTDRLTSLGIRTLRNECETIDGLQLVGLDDLWSRNFRPNDVLPRVDWNEPTITLCHNPDAVDRPELSVCRGWILSGHTHGGQCKPPFLPPPILPVFNTRYTSGEFQLSHDRRLYINPGLGYLRRVRFNVRPEITVFRLMRAEA